MTTPELLGSAMTMSALTASSARASVLHWVSVSALFRNCFGVRVRLGSFFESFFDMLSPNSKR